MDINEDRLNLLNLRGCVDFFNFDWNNIKSCNTIKILKI